MKVKLIIKINKPDKASILNRNFTGYQRTLKHIFKICSGQCPE